MIATLRGISKRFIVLCFSVMTTMLMSGQDVTGDLNQLSDTELRSYWQQAMDQGYTPEQIKSIAIARGLTPEQLANFEQRIGELGLNSDALEGAEIENSLEIANSAGLDGANGNPAVEIEDPLFGYDFFNNPNISFTPNLNLATPANYQLGPGDAVVINLWGAA